MPNKTARTASSSILRMSLAVVLILCAGTSLADVVVNGDFETDAAAFVTWPGYVGGGENPAAITGWTSTGGIAINPVAPGGDGDAPFRDNGANDTRVAVMQGASTLEQDLVGMTLGQEYVLSVDFNARDCCGDLPVATIALDGVLVAATSELFPDPGAVIPVGGTNPWYHADIPFVAEDTAITLMFSSTPAAGGDATMLIDNVSVVPIPEPSTAALALVGLLLLLGWRRR